MGTRTAALWVITDGLLKLAAKFAPDAEFAAARLQAHCSALRCRAQSRCRHIWESDGFGRRMCSKCGKYEMLCENRYPEVGEPRYEWK